MGTTGTEEPVHKVSLPDGRRIAYRVFGDPTGHPVLALHGTPGSRLKYAIAHDVALAAGLKLVSIDRWGYGLTDPHPRPTLAAFADDMAGFTEALGLGRFGILGVSGGGPFAAAVASALPGRIFGLALVAPVGPIVGTPVERSLSPFHLLAFRGLSRTPGVIRLVFGAFRALLSRRAPLAMRIATSRAARVDRRMVCEPVARQSLVDAFVAGLAPGSEGPATDMLLFGRPWETDLSRIDAPARLWIGDQDRHVPIAAALLLAERIPGCVRSELAGAGHYWVLQNMPQVLGWLGERAARAPTLQPAP